MSVTIKSIIELEAKIKDLSSLDIEEAIKDKKIFSIREEINGILENTISIAPPVNLFVDALSLGDDPTHPGLWSFNGFIDDVELWGSGGKIIRTFLIFDNPSFKFILYINAFINSEFSGHEWTCFSTFFINC